MDQGLQAKLSLSAVLKKDLKPADHIVVRGNIENLHRSLKSFYFITGKFYFHHGIYIGNDEVIEFGGNTKRDAKPCTVDILQFIASSCDSTLYRVNEDDKSRALKMEEILRRAFEMLKDPSTWPGYDVIWNNCESFANYIKTGKPYTEQGMNALRRALALGSSLAAGLAGSSIGSVGISGKWGMLAG